MPDTMMMLAAIDVALLGGGGGFVFSECQHSSTQLSLEKVFRLFLHFVFFR